ncbi:MAG: LysE family transporter [Bacteroidetes bacterium]|nr:LysE family transporter [Bacteroidota bacterium]MDA0879052.1 LysE family transporter [Bacteroidota bacterium]MDA1116147.1 LysE family transporter [Bacteroidota bacterium]
MVDLIKTAIPLGFFLSFMLGPVFFMLLETSATKGVRAAISFDIGVLFSDIVFITLAYYSSYQLLESLSNSPVLYLFGGTGMVIYGLVLAIKKVEKGDVSMHGSGANSNYFGLFLNGFLVNIINVGVLIFWVGIVIVVGPSFDGLIEKFLVFFATMLAVYFVTDLFKILVAKQLQSQLTPVRIIWVKKSLGYILVICGIVMIVKGVLPGDELNPANIME